MKKIIFTLALLAATLLAGAQSTVSLTIAGLPDGTVIEAALGSTHADEPPLASATLAGGKATLTVPVAEPRMIDFRAKGVPGTLLHLMTGQGERVTASVAADSTESDGVTYYMGKGEQVYDSPLHAQYMMKLGAFKKFLEIYNGAYHDAYRDINRQISAAYAAKDSAKMARLRASEAWKEFMAYDAQFFNLIEKRYNELFAENDSTWWGPFMRLDVYSYFTPENKADYECLSASAQSSYYGRLLKELVDPKGLKGQDYPRFSVLDANGKTTPSDKIAKGRKYLLVDFWASWCKPCRNEIPNLKACYDQYKNKGLQIVSISLDRSDAAWKKALKEEQLPWPNGVDRSRIADAYKVQSIPAMFLVDVKTGKIIAEGLRGQLLRDKLAEFMK